MTGLEAQKADAPSNKKGGLTKKIKALQKQLDDLNKEQVVVVWLLLAHYGLLYPACTRAMSLYGYV